MIEIDIGWKDVTQKKKFDDEYKAMEWIKKNYENITHINYNSIKAYKLFGKTLTSFDIMYFIRNKA
ncbi:MAG: hypothetical protein IK021_01800 [Methanobrevibacter sp.]|nr:hypothetical protein [Methanobrevibacter sp.]